MSGSLAFTGIADRLGKLIPRLASDHDGEVVATAAAIGRTLAGAGLDWHDLSARVAAPSFADVMAMTTAAPRPTSTTPPGPGATPQRPAGFSNAEWDRAQRRARGEKVGRQPPPWPTWGTLSHFGRLAMFDAILAEAALTEAEAAAMKAFHTTYYRHQCGGVRKATNLFNAACRNLWERGWRPEVAA